jgi:hypothetical protein
MALATLVQSSRPAVGLDVSVPAEGGVTVIALRGEAAGATPAVVADGRRMGAGTYLDARINRKEG